MLNAKMMRALVARRVFVRHLTSEAVPRADVLRAVQGIVQEKAACPPAEAETASLAGDLALKFKVARGRAARIASARERARVGRGGRARARSQTHLDATPNPADPAPSRAVSPARHGLQVLSACERHFQIAIPHAALVDMVDAGSVAAYVESALRANEAADAQAAQHWSKALPSNVSMVGFTAKHQERNERLPELLVTPHGDAKIWNPARQAERE